MRNCIGGVKGGRFCWCEGGFGSLKEIKVGREEKENRDVFFEVSF